MKKCLPLLLCLTAACNTPPPKAPPPRKYIKVEGGQQLSAKEASEVFRTKRAPAPDPNKSVVVHSEAEAQAALAKGLIPIWPGVEPDPFVVVDVPMRKKRFEEEPDPPKLKTLFYRCRYTQAQQVAQVLSALSSSDGTVSTSSYLNMVIVSEQESQMDTIKAYIRALDRAVPQILVNIKVVELSYNKDEKIETGMTFSRKTTAGEDSGGSFFLRDSNTNLIPPGTTSLANDLTLLTQPYRWSRKGLIDKLEVSLRALVNSGKARILSAPNLIVSQGISAKIDTGEQLPVPKVTVSQGVQTTSFDYRNVGIELEVTPKQIEDKVVKLALFPSVKSVPRTITSGDASAPVVANRSVRTELRVGDGELISIGGLLKVEKKELVKKVPLLGDIPILGWLFTSTNEEEVRTQLVFFLQVSILPPEEPGGEKIFIPKEDPRINEFMKGFDKDFKNQLEEQFEKKEEQKEAE